MLALSILVFLLAGPVLKSESSSAPLTYLVEPSLFQQEEMSRILDTIGPGAEVRLLATDFPSYSPDDEFNRDIIPDYWQLVREMHKLNSDSIVVFTAAYAAGFKGRRPYTDQNINWIQIVPDEIVNETIAAVRKGEDLEIISVAGDHTGLSIEKEIINFDNSDITTNLSGDSIRITSGPENFIPLKHVDTLEVSLYNDEDLEAEMRYIRASLIAISEYLRTPVNIKEQSEKDPDANADLLVWLSSSPVKETTSKILIWKPDSLSGSLIEKGQKKNEYYLTGFLNSENITEENLPEQLLQILGINRDLEAQITEYDRRVMPLEEILPQTGSMGGNVEIHNVRDISEYFWILLVIILIAERGISAYRKQ
jgi:hypothetical protein